MGWLDPPTITDGTLIDAAWWNQYVGANLLSVAQQRDLVCLLYKSADQQILHDTATPVSWDAAFLNRGGMWSSGSTISIPKGGRYRLFIIVRFESNGSNWRQVWFEGHTDATLFMNVETACSGSNPTVMVAWADHRFSTGDTTQFWVEQESGSTLALGGAADGRYTVCGVRYLGTRGEQAALHHWHEPRTWITGEHVTPWKLRDEVGSLLPVLYDRKEAACLVYNSNRTEVEEDEDVKVSFDRYVYDYGGLSGLREARAEFLAEREADPDSDEDPPRAAELEIQQDGVYEALGNVSWIGTIGEAGDRALSLYVNEDHTLRVRRQALTESDHMMQPIYGQLLLKAGDRVSMAARAVDPADADGVLGRDEDSTRLAVSLLGELPEGWEDDPDQIPEWTLDADLTDGAVLTAADLNTRLRDKLRYLRHLGGCSMRLRLDDNHAIANAAATPVDWDKTDWLIYPTGTAAPWTIASPTVITLPAGYYLVAGMVRWQADVDGDRLLSLDWGAVNCKLNFARRVSSSKRGNYQPFYIEKITTAPVTVSLVAEHNAGASLKLKSGTIMTITRLGLAT